jgi:hypothetical protein
MATGMGGWNGAATGVGISWMGSDLSTAGAGEYEIAASGSEVCPGCGCICGCGMGSVATGGTCEIGTSRGSGACAAMSIRTRRAVGSAACMPCGATPGDIASAVAPRQTATRRVRILFPMASLSVAMGPIRSS